MLGHPEAPLAGRDGTQTYATARSGSTRRRRRPGSGAFKGATASNKRLAPPRPAAAPEKPGATVPEQFDVRVVSRVVELVRSRRTGFANLETLSDSAVAGRLYYSD